MENVTRYESALCALSPQPSWIRAASVTLAAFWCEADQSCVSHLTHSFAGEAFTDLCRLTKPLKTDVCEDSKLFEALLELGKVQQSISLC